MKRIILLLLLYAGIVFSANAQDEQREAGRLQAYKIAFLTKKLNLSTEEAQKFWPVYNQYSDELRQLRQQNRDLDEVDMEEKIVNLRKKYKDDFAKALPADKVNQFYKVDKEFTMFLRNELQERNELRQQKQKQ